LLQPLCRRTWAPRGQTPIEYAWDRHDRLSAISSLSLSPARRRIDLYFHILRHNARTADLVHYLRQLHRQLRRPLILVCDRYSVHRAAARQLQSEQCRWLSVEWLPAYAPDLNPVEAIWNRTKYAQLSNFIPDDVEHLFDEVVNALNDQCFDTASKRSCFRWAQLDL
jgi:transposase